MKFAIVHGTAYMDRMLDFRPSQCPVPLINPCPADPGYTLPLQIV